jgi:hypothetical protein
MSVRTLFVEFAPGCVMSSAAHASTERTPSALQAAMKAVASSAQRPAREAPARTGASHASPARIVTGATLAEPALLAFCSAAPTRASSAPLAISVAKETADASGNGSGTNCCSHVRALNCARATRQHARSSQRACAHGRPHAGCGRALRAGARAMSAAVLRLRKSSVCSSCLDSPLLSDALSPMAGGAQRRPARGATDGAQVRSTNNGVVEVGARAGWPGRHFPLWLHSFCARGAADRPRRGIRKAPPRERVALALRLYT